MAKWAFIQVSTFAERDQYRIPQLHNIMDYIILGGWMGQWTEFKTKLFQYTFQETCIISSTPTKLTGVMIPADKVLLNPRSFWLQSRRVFGVSCLLITLALFIIKDTAFHITRVIWCVLGVLCYHLWNSIGNLVNLVFGLCQYCSKNSNIQLTKLTNSRFWCEMQYIWWWLKQEHWEDNLPLHTPHYIHMALFPFNWSHLFNGSKAKQFQNGSNIIILSPTRPFLLLLQVSLFWARI